MYHIAAFYQFVDIEDPERAQRRLEELVELHGILGSVLVAPEGVNGTVATDGNGLTAFVDALAEEFDVDREAVKWASSEEPPFRKATVRLKSEIVASGIPELDPNERVGKYVEPEDWDDLVSRDDVVLIDCRNSYEFRVGTFDGAIDPGTETFREFADWAERQLDPESTPRVAMFCTGGIRCEKATSLLLERGFPEVYHLHGGILRYLEARGPVSNTWKGECFVFDRRVSVDAELRPGRFDVCWACRMPVSPEDREHEHFEEGVSCPDCFGSFTPEEMEAKRERHRQFTESISPSTSAEGERGR